LEVLTGPDDTGQGLAQSIYRRIGQGSEKSLGLKSLSVREQIRTVVNLEVSELVLCPRLDESQALLWQGMC
jgi:hypothetical protein